MYAVHQWPILYDIHAKYQHRNVGVPHGRRIENGNTHGALERHYCWKVRFC